MKKYKNAAFVAVIFILVFAVNAIALGWGNQAWFDLTYSFEEAYVMAGDTILAKGRVDSWQDYENSDVVQVKINGVTYLTHYSNVILISE